MVAILLGGVFIFLSIFFGIALSTLLKIAFTLEERICFSILAGHAVSVMIVYFFSYLQGKLDFLTIGIGVLLITVLTILIIVKKKTVIKKIIVFDMERIFIIFFGLIVFISLNLQCVLREISGSLYGSSFVVGDYCFHISVINSFVFRNNFPPKYPVMASTPMAYPPLVDFLSSILMKTGFDLRSSIIIPNILFQVSLLCLISSLAIRLFGRKYIGIVSALLFIFAGNMGIIYAIQDSAKYGFTRWITSLPEDYSGSGVSTLPEIRFGNPITVMLMPQRPSMLGVGISLVIYILMIYAIQREDNKRELVLAGVLNGFLPSIHPHSFIAVSLLLFFMTILFRKGLRFFIYLFTPAIVLALPQIFIIRMQVREGFVSPIVGWLEENTRRIMALDWSTPFSIFISIFKSISILVYFWLMNIGVILIPAFIGFLRSDRKARIFYIPYLVLFLIGNFVKFQPWDWDNYKVLIHWYILTITIAAYGIIEIAKFSYASLKKEGFFSLRISNMVGISTLVGLATILFLGTASGFLSHIKVFQENYLMWPRSDIVFAEWVRENTPQESVFLTSTHFLNPIVTLAGKQVILGYEGWLWSHGLDWALIQKVRSDVIEMFRGNYTIIKKYNVGYIVITRYEHFFAVDNNFEISIDFFEKLGEFEKIYDETTDGNRYVVFKVL